jgi:acyl dehydratase
MRLDRAEPLEGGGLQMAWTVVIEREGTERPVCIAEALVRRY